MLRSLQKLCCHMHFDCFTHQLLPFAKCCATEYPNMAPVGPRCTTAVRVSTLNPAHGAAIYSVNITSKTAVSLSPFEVVLFPSNWNRRFVERLCLQEKCIGSQLISFCIALNRSHWCLKNRENGPFSCIFPSRFLPHCFHLLY